jgi:hypothetical protein
MTLPQIYDWMKPDEVTFRENSDQYLEDALEFSGISDVKSYSAFQDGHSSVVYKFETPDSVGVCKLARENVFGKEKSFYDLCKVAEVPTPSIHKISQMQNGVWACFMEYVPAETLSHVSSTEIVENKIYVELGKILAKLHGISGKGFGLIKADMNEGEFDDIAMALNSSYMDDIRKVLPETNLLKNIELNAIEFAAEILAKDFNNKPGGILCHGDVGNSNIFDMSPPMIFDPHPSYTHPMLDIGLTITYASQHTENFQRLYSQLVEGYSSIRSIDKLKLSAGILVNAGRKLVTAIRKKNEKRQSVYVELIRSEVKNI